MKRIVLLRHGESMWNKENRFTGWTDVSLSEQGITEAYDAGITLRTSGFDFRLAYTSMLKRAVKTLDCVLDAMDRSWVRVEKSWRLNEKHYGALQGLNKSETAALYGNEQVYKWRRSYDIAPEPVPVIAEANPANDRRYHDVPRSELPLTESLKDTVERVIPYWRCEIFAQLAYHDDILVVAHGNSLRAIIKHVKAISDNDISELNIPTATPYILEFDDSGRLANDFYLGDEAKIREKAEAVARQGVAER